METDDSARVRAVLGRDGHRICGQCGQTLYTDELLHYNPTPAYVAPIQVMHTKDCYYLHDLTRETCAQSNDRHTKIE